MSGHISALAIAGNSLFVGAASGGIWRSDDFTRPINGPAGPPTWTPVTDTVGLNQMAIVDTGTGLGAGAIDIGAIAVSPRTDNQGRATLYAGTGEANFSDSRYGTGVMKSTDGGTTWELVSTGPIFPGGSGLPAFFRRSISEIVVDPRSTQNDTLYAAVVVDSAGGTTNGENGRPNLHQDLGIYKSTNGGVDWTKLTHDQQAPDLTFPGIGEGLTVTDLDYIWTQPQGNTPGTLTLYAGVKNKSKETDDVGAVYRSCDGGVTWQRLDGPNSPLGLHVGRVALAADHTSGANVVYVAVADNTSSVEKLLNIYRLTDNGNTWTWGLLPPRDATGNDLMIDQGQMDYNMALGLSPNGRLYLGAQTKVLEMTPAAGGGVVWRDITGGANAGKVHADHHAFVFTPNGNLYDGNDGGLWRYTPAAGGLGTWENLNNARLRPDGTSTGLSTIQFYGLDLSPNSSSILIGGSQDNGYVRTDNTGKYWTQLERGDGTQVRFAPSQGNTVYRPDPARSINGGKKWSALDAVPDPSGAQYNRLAVRPDDATHVLLSGPGGDVWVTDRGGIREPEETDSPWYALTNLTTKLSDAGVTALTYAPQQVPGGKLTWSKVAYVGYANGQVFRTDNADVDRVFAPATWAAVTGNWGPRPIGSITVDPKRPGVAYLTIADFFDGRENTAAFGQVYWTGDWGRHWIVIGGGATAVGGLPNVPARSIVLDSSQQGFPTVYRRLQRREGTRRGLDLVAVRRRIPAGSSRGPCSANLSHRREGAGRRHPRPRRLDPPDRATRCPPRCHRRPCLARHRGGQRRAGHE